MEKQVWIVCFPTFKIKGSSKIELKKEYSEFKKR
jgi:hypothetical protein